MARLKHADHGVVVEVSDEMAARMGGRWAPVKDAAKPAPKRDTKSADEK